MSEAINDAMNEKGSRPHRKRSWKLILSSIWIISLVIMAVFAPIIAPKDPLAQDLMTTRLPPFWQSGGETGFLLGADSLGRDVFSRIIYGARVALIVAFAAAFSTCLLGSSLGLMAGYYRGWFDKIMQRIVDIWMAFPPVLFAILLIAVLGTGLGSVIIAIAVIDWTRFFRVVRSETISQSKMDYVDSSTIAGRSNIGNLIHEILPNVLPTVLILLSLEMSIAVMVEAILSFVNLSISSDVPTWGGMISEGRNYINQSWWVLCFPLLFLFLTVLSFAQFGQGLKERYDPVLR